MEEPTPSLAGVAAPQPEPALSVVPTEPAVEAARLKQEAVTVARQVANAYPDNALSHALLGSASYNTGHSEEAVRHLQRCLELDPEQAEAYEILARISYEKGDLDECVRLCQEALKRSPANMDALNRLGRAFLDLGRTDEAVQTLQKGVALAKPSSESCYLLGQAHLQSGDYAAAKENFSKVIALVPDHTQAFFGLFTACQRLGQTNEAAAAGEQFQKLEALDRRALTDRSAQEDTLTGLPLVRKTVARTLFGAGQIHSVHREEGKAADLFRRAAALDADHPGYRAALEAHYVRTGAIPEAVAVFEQLADAQPESGLNYFFLGRLQSRLNQFEAAERAYLKVQELMPEWPEGHRALAELYLRAGRKPDEARALAERLIGLAPTGNHYYLLSVARLKSNDRAGALAAAKQAVALSPGEQKFQELFRQLKETP